MANSNAQTKSTLPTLDQIALELGIEPEDWGNFYCKSKNEFICLNIDAYSGAEIEDDMAELDEDELENGLSDWEQEEYEEAKTALNNPDDYIRLPSQFEIDEMQIMKNFICEIQDERASDKLWDALEKRRPYRGFKDAVIYLGIEDQWYAFRHDAFREIAKVWCEENNIAYIDA